MIEVIYRGEAGSNTYLDAQNSLAALVAQAKSNGDEVYLRTPMLCVFVAHGHVQAAESRAVVAAETAARKRMRLAEAVR